MPLPQFSPRRDTAPDNHGSPAIHMSRVRPLHAAPPFHPPHPPRLATPLTLKPVASPLPPHDATAALFHLLIARRAPPPPHELAVARYPASGVWAHRQATWHWPRPVGQGRRSALGEVLLSPMLQFLWLCHYGGGAGFACSPWRSPRLGPLVWWSHIWLRGRAMLDHRCLDLRHGGRRLIVG
jgi:hypothetical protein